ncbi:MAG: hypothetical protein JRH15_15045, partial [Deltaproteobacteria bacterium]|nr:hypothetical protein [Deltaproteobacteria bacterium]
MKKAWYSKIALCVLLAGTLAIGAPWCVWAADETEEDYILEDTVVTATKTGETKIQETPIAMT